MPVFFAHTTRNITFTLMVDYFGICYQIINNLTRLRNTVNSLYTTTFDTTKVLYCGISLLWNYINQYVNVSMPGYVERVLTRFNVNMPVHPQYSPHAHNYSNYGVAIQFTSPVDTSKLVSVDNIRMVQEIIGTLLYYAYATNSTILVELGILSQQQTKATQYTSKSIEQFFTYVAIHPDATFRYDASNMILYIHSDASYLLCLNARSRVGG